MLRKEKALETEINSRYILRVPLKPIEVSRKSMQLALLSERSMPFISNCFIMFLLLIFSTQCCQRPMYVTLRVFKALRCPTYKPLVKKLIYEFASHPAMFTYILLAAVS